MLAVAVGHPEDEEALAFMRVANFRRAEEACLNLAAQAEKVSSDPFGTAFGEHASDVFDEDEPRPGLDEDAPGRAPEVALVISPKSFAGEAVGLAGNAPDDAIHTATEASAWEGSHITVDRRWSHDAALHLRDQISDGECLPLHTSDCASRWDCQLDGPIKAASAGAEGDNVEGVGTKIHTQRPPDRTRTASTVGTERSSVHPLPPVNRAESAGDGIMLRHPESRHPAAYPTRRRAFRRRA